ncbi:molybdate ABC transporter, permease protein [Asticcacaulis biprosthecium C19]|uniref:Molybdenum transport system permease n=1 Tax=Asticcacaulis biprosthecium C19 TaxID=715226 RepID=F4QRS7_9CAUL|nr:molybdate ABC transporter permease subunit [Asticcacaulis biprosthecium]EGF89447.1 molybdate ABC transporter, permease protein [Asticcacaulis biprosthecium C19]
MTGLGDAIIVTINLAAVTTVCLVVLATPLAWWLSRGHGLVRDVVTAVVALPVVLPPTVLGFYLLVAMGPNSPLMVVLQPFGVRTLNFTFAGLVIGSILYSLPFAVQPIRNAFEAIGALPFEVAATLRASPWDAFWSVALPQARKGFLTAALLVFAHTVGEFGVVLMIGGAIPGKTEVVSIRIFQLVEQLNFAGAHWLAGGLLVFAFVVLLALLVIERRIGRAVRD